MRAHGRKCPLACSSSDCEGDMGTESNHMKIQWDITVYKMVAPTHKLASEAKQ